MPVSNLAKYDGLIKESRVVYYPVPTEEDVQAIVHATVLENKSNGRTAITIEISGKPEKYYISVTKRRNVYGKDRENNKPIAATVLQS